MKSKNKKVLLELPLVRFAPFMAAGMLTAYFGGGLLCGIIFAAAAASVIYFAVRRNKLAISAAGLAWGLVVMTAYTSFYCKPITEFGGKTVRAEFVVREASSASGGVRRYIVEMNLSGKKAKVEITDSERFEIGSKAVGIIELSAPDSSDMAQNLADGVLLSGEITELISVGAGEKGITSVIRGMRTRMTEAVSENIFGKSGEIALAILLGDDSQLSAGLREKLKICGAAHYMAVSGSHFAIFAAVLLGVFKKNKKVHQAFSLIFAPAAVVFFGSSPSVLRASVMFLLYCAASLFYRAGETLNTLCLTIVIICTFSPGTILDTGFAMSVLGVFGAGVVGDGISTKLCELLPHKLKKPISPVITIVTASICAVICTAPISVFVFKGVSLSGAVSSLILMPLMTVGIMFLVPLGITKFGLLAIPVDFSMRAAVGVIEFFGHNRGLWLTMDFKYAWALAALCAVLVAVGAFGNMKTLTFAGIYMMAVTFFTLLILQFVCGSRSEVRFVGNYSTGAAVIFEKNEAVVFISGKGTGLATSISRIMREHGAVKISCLAAFDADYGGALAIRELSELTDIDVVYSNEVARKLLTDMDVKLVSADSRLSVSGVTIAAAKSSDKTTNADIVLYNGRITKTPESPARYAVYFSSTEKDMPENWYNARLIDDFYIRLENGTKSISVIE